MSCARQVSGLRRRDVALDVIALGEPGPGVAVLRVARDGGADLHVTRGPSAGLAEQRIWGIVQRQHAQQPYTLVAGFGANLPGYVAVAFAAWLGLPSLVSVRGNDFDRDLFDPRRGWMVREALSRATVVGAVSPEKVRRIRAMFPDADVRWTPNGVDVSQWELLPGDRAVRDEVRSILAVEGRRVVGLFGELKYKKRIPLWLGALRDAGLAGRVGLLIVGRLDGETQQIHDDPALAPLHHRVSFSNTGKLPGLYAACDYTAIPSMYEGMPNVLLEAMAAGVVPIVSDAGAMAEIVADGATGFVFPAEDRAAAAEATRRALALSDADLADMKARAQCHVRESFSPERELDVLWEAIGGRGPRMENEE